MKKIIATILGVGALAGSSMFTSCNFLDVDHYFRATFKEDSVFHSKENALGYLWNTPQDFPDPGSLWGASWNPGQTASDEIAIKWQSNEFWGARFATGQIDENNLPNWSLWSRMYVTIQRCNKMLANVDKVGGMVDADRREYRAYVHFLRGWAYYHLLMNWGPLLIVGDEVMATNADNDYYDRERATFDESIDYICNEFAQAVKLGIASARDQSLVYFERPTKGAALALIARLRLMQASPTFNGGDAARKAFNGWKRKSDGKDYINQTPDPKRWAVAAAAAKQVIDLDYYELHTVKKEKDFPYPLHESVPTANFPEGAGDIDPFRSFTDMFNGEGLPKTNRELIWAKVASGGVMTYTRHSFPVGGGLGGWGGLCVPQRVVDCFLMEDGKLPSESDLYEPDVTKTTETNKQLSTFVLKSGVLKMFDKRSARFYASIGFPGRLWEMNTASSEAAKANKQFWYDNSDAIGGKSGAQNNPNDVNITGYVPVKYIHPDDSWANVSGANRTVKPFPTIRYAEVLLILCEAMNNITDASGIKTWDATGELVDVAISRDTEMMKKYFNMIRYRVGLPGVEDAVLADPVAFDKVIRNERQVELFNEGHRYFDTRRWGTYLDEDAEGKNWRGFDVSKDRDASSSNSGFYNLVQINEQNYRDRIARPKMIFLPLNHNELLKTPKMDQNWGWER